MITRCYFNKTLMCSRSIDRAKKELLVQFVDTPNIQGHYPVVFIDNHEEPNHISQSYDAPEALKAFRKWTQEKFENVTLISQNNNPSGTYARFSYDKIDM